MENKTLDTDRGIIAIASDHAALRLKSHIASHLENIGFEVVDLGTNSPESCDYPVYAKKLCDFILDPENDCALGILCCGTGIGMSIAANKVHGIRAACCSDSYSAKFTRLHNNANVLCLGERVIGFGLADEIVDLFVNTEFEGGKHARRLSIVEKIESGESL